jgi:hypothetical protein
MSNMSFDTKLELEFNKIQLKAQQADTKQAKNEKAFESFPA